MVSFIFTTLNQGRKANLRPSLLIIKTNNTELSTLWKHWGDPTDSSDYFHVLADSPSKAFQPLINKFRGLEYLGTPPFMEFNNDLFLECGRTAPED